MMQQEILGLKKSIRRVLLRTVLINTSEDWNQVMDMESK